MHLKNLHFWEYLQFLDAFIWYKSFDLVAVFSVLHSGAEYVQFSRAKNGHKRLVFAIRTSKCDMSKWLIFKIKLFDAAGPT